MYFYSQRRYNRTSIKIESEPKYVCLRKYFSCKIGQWKQNYMRGSLIGAGETKHAQKRSPFFKRWKKRTLFLRAMLQLYEYPYLFERYRCPASYGYLYRYILCYALIEISRILIFNGEHPFLHFMKCKSSISLTQKNKSLIEEKQLCKSSLRLKENVWTQMQSVNDSKTELNRNGMRWARAYTYIWKKLTKNIKKFIRHRLQLIKKYQ